MAKFHVGVDVGRARHLARVLDTTTAHLSRPFQIPVSHEGFESFRRYLEGFSPNPQDFFVAIEATGAYHVPLANYLWDCGYTLALVNPARAKAFRKAEGHILVIIGRKLLDRIWAIARAKGVFSPLVSTPLDDFRRAKVAAHF